MPRNAILVTGGTGFVGSHVVRALLAEDTHERPEIRVLSRGELPSWMVDAGVTGIRGDLSNPADLRGVCDDVVTLIHLAATVGRDVAECDSVNTDGTLAVLDQARRAGTKRVIYVSTTSVYGNGVHQGVTESLLAPAPVSAASRSKLAAERAVRAVGGIVLRPHLTYGPGDRWFVPTLLRLLDKVPAWIDGGSALMSIVSVQDLAKVPAALARLPWGPRPGAVFHVSQPRPVSVHAMAHKVCAPLGLTLPEHDLPSDVHRELTRSAIPNMTDHQFSLLAEDHWYESTRIWRTLGITPTELGTAEIDDAVGWYRTLLAA
ncbi:NAD-dependent epimerase/dehydratase family protein [Actinophytocola sp. NPDC049390]|uniref:NAD-dependent epimerase/dehydratase family protein n=1 Tax=Actinophytocola sp. NPDC049390 TaxID=3363894 RepID=UPI0037A96C1F